MEHQKKLNFEADDSKFATRKWNIVNDQSNGNYVGNEIIYNTQMLKSNLCDYNDAHVLERDYIFIYRACCSSSSI